MRHPDPHGPPDRTPIEVGEVWVNPVTRERATILERTWDNPEGRATAELTALVGARVMGEHLPSRSGRALHRARGRADRKTQRADRHSASGRDGRHRARRMARLVECERPRRAGTGGDHPRRAVRAHDRDLLRPRAARTHRQQGHAASRCNSRYVRASSATWSCSVRRRWRCSARSLAR